MQVPMTGEEVLQKARRIWRQATRWRIARAALVIAAAAGCLVLYNSAAASTLLTRQTTVAAAVDRTCSYLESSSYHRLYGSSGAGDTACPTGRLVTINHSGRLGNQMCQYLSLFALACEDPTARPAWIHADMASQLDQYFTGVSLPTLSARCHRSIGLVNISYHLYGASRTRYVNQPILLADHPCDQRLFSRYRPDVLKQLQWRPHILQAAQISFHKLTSSHCSGGNCTFIGVHVRRGDYERYYRRKHNTTLVTPSFFLRALDLCRGRYSNPVFLVVSDDMAWCRQHLQASDVVFAGTEGPLSPGIDMAVMSLCNHTVMDYGTFGKMGSFLAGGDIIVAESVYRDQTSRLTSYGVNFTIISRQP